MPPTNSRLLQCIYDLADCIIIPPISLSSPETGTASYSPVFLHDGQYPTFLRLDETIPAHLTQSLKDSIDAIELGGSFDPARLLTYLDMQRNEDPLDFAGDVEALGDESQTSKLTHKLLLMAKAILFRLHCDPLSFNKPTTPYLSVIPDQVVKVNTSNVIHWEDKAARKYDKYSRDLVALASSEEEGKNLHRPSNERNAESILYKIGVYMIGHSMDWGVLFGGHKATIFRIAFSPPNNQGATRPGLVCSRQMSITAFFPLLISMLLCPRERSIHFAPIMSIPVPTAAPPPSSRFLRAKKLAKSKLSSVSEEITTLFSTNKTIVSFSGKMSLSLFRSEATPSSPSSPPDSPTPITPPTSFTFPQTQKHVLPPIAANVLLPMPLLDPVVISIDGCINGGSIGAIFRGFYSSLDLVLKVVPTESTGADALLRELKTYEALTPIQGTVVPRCFGLFGSAEWMALVLEDVGPTLDGIGGIGVLCHAQRSTIVNHLEAIHRLGIVHGDIKNDNIGVAGDGSIRIFDFSHSFPEDGGCLGREQCHELRDVIRDMDL